VNAGFEFLEFVEARLEAIERLDDVGETLVVFLAPDARLHPTVEKPNGKDENPDFHGTSGPGDACHVLDRESL
jgi:hypothetical protein